MRRLGAALAVFAAVLLLASASAAAGTVDLLPGRDAPALAPLVDVLQDPGGDLTIDDVTAPDAAFAPNRSLQINFGIGAPTVWLRLGVRNRGDEPGHWVLSLNRALLEVLEVHLASADGRTLLLSRSRAGDMSVSFARYGTLAATFELPPGAEGVLYIRYRGPNSSSLTPTIETAESLRERRRQVDFIYLAAVAGVLTLVLSGVVTFGLTGLRPHLYFAFGQIVLLVQVSHLAGYTTAYLWPEQPEIGRPLASLLMTAHSLLMLQFTRSLIGTVERVPRVDRVLAALLLLGLLPIGSALLELATGLRVPGPGSAPAFAVTAATWIALPILAVVGTFRWKAGYWPLAVAWTCYAALFFYGAGSALALWRSYLGTVEIYAVAVYFEALFLSLVLALHVRDLRRQAFAAMEGELAASRRSEQLARQNAMALQELAEKGRLLRAAGHDTRQMLYSLRHYAAGLSAGADAARLEEARRSIGRLADHLDDVLATTIDAGHSGGIDDRVVALDAMPAAAILNPMRLIHERAAAAKGLRFRCRPGDLQIVSDRVLVMRIVSNLVGNAVKYADAGGVLLACRRGAGHLRLQVWDSGRGLTPARLARLLDNARGQQRFAADEPGLGSGLETAKALAARLGGRIHACSRPGRGSLFELLLPDLPPTGRPDGAQPAWLVVGADRDFRRQIASLAATLGATRIEEADGIDRLGEAAAAGDGRPIVIVDADDPGPENLDGKRLAACRSRTILATYDRGAETRARLAQSCDTLLYKPVTAAALRLALRRLAG